MSDPIHDQLKYSAELFRKMDNYQLALKTVNQVSDGFEHCYLTLQNTKHYLNAMVNTLAAEIAASQEYLSKLDRAKHYRCPKKRKNFKRGVDTMK